MKLKQLFFLILILFTSVLFLGCKADDNDDSSSTSSEEISLNGSVFAAAVNGAKLTVLDENGSNISEANVSSDGSFSVKVPKNKLGSILIFKSIGGSYTDEVTDQVITLGSSEELSLIASANTFSEASADVHLTPSSTIIKFAAITKGGTLADDITTVKTDFESNFGYQPDHSVQPVNATETASAEASEDKRLKGLRAAAFSQLTKNILDDATQQMKLIKAMGSDLSDGTMDGKSSGTSISGGSWNLSEDIQNLFSNALFDFFNDSTKNKSGLKANKIGTPPFAKTTLTTSYKVEYVPGMMSAMEGKTMFKIKVSNKSSGAAVTGLTVKVTPTMHMETMSHGSAGGDGNSVTCSDKGDGTYACKVYYLMASAMSNGMAMGIWRLKTELGSETAYFFPKVKMAMKDTARVILKNGNDQYKSMSGAAVRNYFIFREDLSGDSNNHTFKIYLAARNVKMMKMSHPGISVGTVLQNSSGADATVDSLNVQFSTNGSSYVDATSDGSGYWSKTGLSGLTSGQQGKISVKFSLQFQGDASRNYPESGSPGEFTVTVP